MSDPLLAAGYCFVLTAFVCVGLGGEALAAVFSRKVHRCAAHLDALHRFDESGWWVVAQSFGCMAAAGFLAWYMASWLVAVPAAAAGWMGPEYFLAGKVRRRHEELLEQLDHSMMNIVNGLRAGLPLMEAIQEGCRQRSFRRPSIEEFEVMAREYALGATLPEVLGNAKKRFQSKDFRVFCSAILISMEQGGNLADNLTRTTTFMREMNRLRAFLKVKTAQGRKSAQVMRLLPVFIVGMLYLGDPEGVTLMFNTLIGQAVLLLALALNLVAYFWTKTILETEL